MPSKKKRAASGSMSEGERLQKVLAAAGIASRRECELLISEGRVEVDRKVVTELGTRVDTQRQKVRVDGELIRTVRPVYYMVNKPAGIVSTHRDPTGRQRVIDLVDSKERLFTVGRLDMASDGLILLTNDGDLANQLAHPRYEVPKTYRVLVAGEPDREVLQQLRKGIYLSDGKVTARKVTLKRSRGTNSTLEITLTEGRNREIRRMMARVGHKVLKLTRIAIGGLKLGKLEAGAYRRMTGGEIRELKRSLLGQRSKSRSAKRQSDDPPARRKKKRAGRPTTGRGDAGQRTTGRKDASGSRTKRRAR